MSSRLSTQDRGEKKKENTKPTRNLQFTTQSDPSLIPLHYVSEDVKQIQGYVR